jgi:hypothetical protein
LLNWSLFTGIHREKQKEDFISQWIQILTHMILQTGFSRKHKDWELDLPLIVNFRTLFSKKEQKRL